MSGSKSLVVHLSGQSASGEAQRPALTPPISLLGAGFELELTASDHHLVIGSAPSCDLILKGELVSPEHARLRLLAQEVWLDVLDAESGVYLNEQLVADSRPLYDGDRVLIGMAPLSFFAVRSGRKPKRTSGISLSEATHEIARDVAASIELSVQGEVVEAEQLLAIQLVRLLRLAGQGHSVPKDLRELISECAMSAARRTQDSLWIDWLVELHLITDSLLSATLVLELAELHDLRQRADRQLFSQYVSTLSQRHRSLSDAELAVLVRLAELSH